MMQCQLINHVNRTGNITVVHHPHMQCSNPNDSRDLKKLTTDACYVYTGRHGIQQNPVSLPNNEKS